MKSSKQQIQASLSAETGNFLLHEAALKGYLEAVKLLLGAVEETEKIRGWLPVDQENNKSKKETPVHMAAKAGHTE